MIVGIGIDLVETKRIQKILERRGERFLYRICRPSEIRQGITAPLAHAQHVAGRVAAKEAIAKALGTGIIGTSVKWQDIEVTTLTTGQPKVTLHGQAAKIAHENDVAKIHISISHLKDYTIAVAIAEKT
jgi:holo-[acyl-carrier protein] synthase